VTHPAELQPGAELARLDIPIGVSDIVAMSIATRDFHPVHHDTAVARALGHPGLFINIMTTSGLIERFVRARCPEGATLRSLKLKLGVPHHADNVLSLSGTVEKAGAANGVHWAELSITAGNPLGRHAAALVRVEWPS
jgi:hypothetical protein